MKQPSHYSLYGMLGVVALQPTFLSKTTPGPMRPRLPISSCSSEVLQSLNHG